ncbi:MAG: orotidine-5'-phosphate decarboxylase [Varibaculum sp.]|nr:orotidine-5'-phosphate decarboxylase [Varibaculum sp.]
MSATDSPTPYGERLAEALSERGNICVGIDPHPQLLDEWSLPQNARGVRDFALRTLEAISDQVAAIKPQSAFFEEYGSAGVEVLEELLAGARELGVLTILDVKRGDIGSTMAGYARAYLSEHSSLRADAVTVSPYLGVGSLQPAFEMAGRTGRGLYVLGLTSNPEGAQVQHARDKDSRAVAATVVDEVEMRNQQLTVGSEIGHIAPFGLVVGATIGCAAQSLDINFERFSGSFLSPGIGAQGAGVDEVKAIFGAASARVLVSVSRAVLTAGPDNYALRRAAENLRVAMKGVLADK